MAGSDGKMRCPVCHNMHVGQAAQAADTAVRPEHVLAQRLQEEVHQAVARVTGGDPRHAAVVTNAMLATAATFAVQTAVVGTDPDADITADHTSSWAKNFTSVAGSYHRQVCQAMQLPVAEEEAAAGSGLELPDIGLSS